MIMPHLGYRNMGASDFPSWSEWIATVNEAIRYCRALPPHRVKEWRFKCRPSDLPSFHPYWKMVVHSASMRYGQRHRDNLAACRKDKTLLRVFYNATTSMRMLEARVAAYPRRRQDWAKALAP